MKRTIRISETITLPVTADDLWTYVEDYGNDTKWRRGLEQMTPTPAGPPRVGTTVLEVLKKLGSTYVTESTVTHTGNRSYRFSGSGDSGGVQGGRSVVGDSGGESSFTYDIVLHVEGINALLSPAVRIVMTGGLRRDLRRLRAVLSGANQPNH